jgi:group I intron endonuclease
MQHRKQLQCGAHHCHALQGAWNKHGESLIFRIFEQCSKECLIEREQYWMNFFISIGTVLYNSSRIAGRIELSPEARKRIGDKQRGIPRKKASEETRRKMSETRKKLVRSPEHLAKLKERATEPKSPETRLKMSIAAHNRWAKAIAERSVLK